MKKLVLFICVLLMPLCMFAKENAQKVQVYEGEDMVTVENLRLRSIFDSKQVLYVLNAGSHVKVMDIDRQDVIDGIESVWVEVEVQPGTVDNKSRPVPYGVRGRCFAGYLKEGPASNLAYNYGGGNGSVLSQSENQQEAITVRKFVQNIHVGEMAGSDQRQVRSKPSADKDSEVLYVVKDGDELDVREMWYVTGVNSSKTVVYLKANVNGTSGFVYYTSYDKNELSDSDPFVAGRWSIMETINSGNRKWTVRKMGTEVSVFAADDSIELRDKPGIEGTKVIGTVPSSYRNGSSQINVVAEAVTEEKRFVSDADKYPRRWVRITWNGITGWAYDGLTAERGGPTYYIPEDLVQFHLGDAP